MICLFKIRFELVNMTFALCSNAILVKKIGCFWLYVTNLTVTHVMPFSERLKMEFYCWMFWRCAHLISDENMHVCKYESKAYMKTKHTSKQKSYVFADPTHIFSHKGSITTIWNCLLNLYRISLLLYILPDISYQR